MKRIKRLVTLLLPVALLWLGGCASTQGSARLLGSPGADSLRSRFSNLVVDVQSKSDLTLNPYDRERIANLIVKSIKVEAPNLFATINQPNPGPGTLQAVVMIKRYDEGSAFARAMLIGLGQMHIDADVNLNDWATKGVVAQYEVTKTFAWGGLYGGFTGIKDVEDGFSKAVAASIVGGSVGGCNGLGGGEL